MPPYDMPLNAAHQHASNAEDYMAQGLLIPASEEHQRAAEAFHACIEASTEENTKRTLRLLYNDHQKASKELQRKIAKLREENKDPSLPQKPVRNMNSNGISAGYGGPSNAPIVPPQPTASPPPHARNTLSDSQQTVGESFMLLGGQRSEGGDAFNHFWKITEGMLDYLSQPVAFATAPLGPPEDSNGPSISLSRRREPGSSSDTDADDSTTRRTASRGMSFMKAAKSRMLQRNGKMSDSGRDGRAGLTTFPPQPHGSFVDDWDEDELDADDDDMADSFCLIPSKSEPSMSALKKENATLKTELEEMQKRVETADRTLKQRYEQDQQLKDSILLARKEIQAQRAMTSSLALRPPVDLASLNINTAPVPPPVPVLNPSRDREAQHLRRIRELEDELRNARIENEKQKAMIIKFRERWEKLKESAKRKKQAKAAAEATSVVGDRIDEEPEAEAAAEKDDLKPGGVGLD
ncbi:hypothetical protein ABKN59_003795 [Abortiporus biennis]